MKAIEANYVKTLYYRFLLHQSIIAKYGKSLYWYHAGYTDWIGKEVWFWLLPYINHSRLTKLVPL